MFYSIYFTDLLLLPMFLFIVWVFQSKITQVVKIAKLNLNFSSCIFPQQFKRDSVKTIPYWWRCIPPVGEHSTSIYNNETVHEWITSDCVVKVLCVAPSYYCSGIADQYPWQMFEGQKHFLVLFPTSGIPTQSQGVVF